MTNRLKLIIVLFFLLGATGLHAAEWQPLGSSDIGQHLVDRSAIEWDDDKTAFSIATKVIQKDGVEWLTTLRVDCKTETFSYLRGSESKDDKVITHFDEPRPSEKIQPQSMPYQLSEEFCGKTKPAQAQDWQEIGTSSIATVFFDRSNLRRNKEGSRFIADTKVVPFDGGGETLSTLAFDCQARTFTVMKMSKVKDGEEEHVFDKPQPPASIDKTATLASLAKLVCSPAEECSQVVARLKSIETNIQANYEHGNLSCKAVEKSVKQIEALSRDATKYNCRIAGLNDYMDEIKQAGCQ